MSNSSPTLKAGSSTSICDRCWCIFSS